MWLSEYASYGAITFKGSEVQVFKDRWNYIRVSCNRPVEHVYWAGLYLIVRLQGGEIRRYMDNWNYERIS